MSDAINEELQFEILGRVAQALVDATTQVLRTSDDFLPLGAVLVAGPQVKLVAARPEAMDGTATPANVLSLVRQTVGDQARNEAADAVALCESVSADMGNGQITAIKVMAEHRAGLCVTFHVPWRKSPSGDVMTDPGMADETDPEIADWR